MPHQGPAWLRFSCGISNIHCGSPWFEQCICQHCMWITLPDIQCLNVQQVLTFLLEITLLLQVEVAQEDIMQGEEEEGSAPSDAEEVSLLYMCRCRCNAWSSRQCTIANIDQRECGTPSSHVEELSEGTVFTLQPLQARCRIAYWPAHQHDW